ncbi:MAG: dimethyl sulfoxide reductase anchor subunit [Proteobacteria bacterium]|nr:dimethyl sulfoxide reductase anchor subunit [Pseudomonadota bacterium]
MSFGPRPWQQRHWDWRAACNFMFGGTGTGLVIAAVLAGPRQMPVDVLAGLAFVGLGLAAVWLEIGRPWRALNVMFNPFTSWMTRESFASLPVFALGAAAALRGDAALGALAAAAALLFVYCQARILRGAKGIPAWREPALTPLVLCTALAEGAGAACLLALPAGGAGSAPSAWLALALLARVIAWAVYRGRIAKGLAADARTALDVAGRSLLQLGTLAPLALLVAGVAFEPAAQAGTALAGLAALATGWRFKFVLLTRAAYNQGFALPHLPMRGRA